MGFAPAGVLSSVVGVLSPRIIAGVRGSNAGPAFLVPTETIIISDRTIIFFIEWPRFYFWQRPIFQALA
jgi:hypothetical protein